MSRKELTVTIPFDGRDKGKVFHITEWDSETAETWGIRSIAAVAKSGRAIPDAIKGTGMMGIATMGLQAMMDIDTEIVIRLLNELLECVKYQPDPKQEAVRRPLIRDDIEEVRTRLFLKAEVFQLHTGFTFAEIKEKLTSAAAQYLGSLTPTSPAPLEP